MAKEMRWAEKANIENPCWIVEIADLSPSARNHLGLKLYLKAGIVSNDLLT